MWHCWRFGVIDSEYVAQLAARLAAHSAAQFAAKLVAKLVARFGHKVNAVWRGMVWRRLLIIPFF